MSPDASPQSGLTSGVGAPSHEFVSVYSVSSVRTVASPPPRDRSSVVPAKRGVTVTSTARGRPRSTAAVNGRAGLTVGRVTGRA